MPGNPNISLKPMLSKAESKSSMTTKVARSIIDSEAAQRRAKTERLRQARIAQEAADREAAASQPEPVKKTPVRKSRAKAAK